jgi:ribosomal protein S18 acetylase RimI-like enzyme
VAEIRDATPEDLDAVFGLLAARSRAAFGSSEEERRFLEHAFALPGTDRWVAERAGAVVGYASLDSAQDLTHAAQDAGVGDALLARALERARERDFAHVACIAVPQDEPLRSLVERNGFTHDRDILRMWRLLDGELPEASWTTGVTVRGYDATDGERVHALLDASYAGWDPDYVERPHEDWVSFMTDHEEFDPALWFLVERDGELVACALHWAEHQRRGWVKDIVVRESERGRGIGKALLHHAFRAYAARGADRVGLKVDSTNPTGAPQLYERVGFATDRRYGIWTVRL